MRGTSSIPTLPYFAWQLCIQECLIKEEMKTCRCIRPQHEYGSNFKAPTCSYHNTGESDHVRTEAWVCKTYFSSLSPVFVSSAVVIYINHRDRRSVLHRTLQGWAHNASKDIKLRKRRTLNDWEHFGRIDYSAKISRYFFLLKNLLFSRKNRRNSLCWMSRATSW